MSYRSICRMKGNACCSLHITNTHTDTCTHTHSLSIYLNSGILTPYGAPKVQDTIELFKGNGRRKRRWGFFGEVDGGQGCCGVHREVVVAFMVIASQHPIVSGLSGRSNLGAEFVAFRTMTDQTYCHIQESRGLCYTFMLGRSWVL